MVSLLFKTVCTVTWSLSAGFFAYFYSMGTESLPQTYFCNAFIFATLLGQPFIYFKLRLRSTTFCEKKLNPPYHSQKVYGVLSNEYFYYFLQILKDRIVLRHFRCVKKYYSETLNNEYIGRIYQKSSWQFCNGFYTILRKFQYLWR